MRSLLLILLLLLPFAEIRLLWWVGAEIGAAQTFALLVLAALLGGAVIRQAGLRTLSHARAELLAGRSPGGELLQGMILFAAGVLLIVPGFVTDAAGLLLLVPGARRTLAVYIGRKFTGNLTAFTFPGAPRNAGNNFTSAPESGQIRETTARVIEESSNHEP